MKEKIISTFNGRYTTQQKVNKHKMFIIKLSNKMKIKTFNTYLILIIYTFDIYEAIILSLSKDEILTGKFAIFLFAIQNFIKYF